MPFVAQVAVGVRPIVNIFGNDYSTADGTGVRDYIHVVDLSIGHLLSLYKLSSMTPGETKVYNLGTGEGYSVLDMIKAMSVACGHDIPYNVCGVEKFSCVRWLVDVMVMLLPCTQILP